MSTLPFPARSPDLNPLEHLWDILGWKIREITPPVLTLLKLEAALHREWQQIPQQRIQCLVQDMRRHLDAPIAVQGYIQEAHGPRFAHLSESHFDTFNINVYGPHK